jgi:hypothetical protein
MLRNLVEHHRAQANSVCGQHVPPSLVASALLTDVQILPSRTLASGPYESQSIPGHYHGMYVADYRQALKEPRYARARYPSGM